MLELVSFLFFVFLFFWEKGSLVCVYCKDKVDPGKWEIDREYYAHNVPTPLFAACSNEVLMKKLLHKGADPNGMI